MGNRGENVTAATPQPESQPHSHMSTTRSDQTVFAQNHYNNNSSNNNNNNNSEINSNTNTTASHPHSHPHHPPPFKPLTSYIDIHPPDSPFITWIDPSTATTSKQTLTFEEFKNKSLEVARAISGRYGVVKGDAVVLDLEPGVDFFVGFVACLYIGG